MAILLLVQQKPLHRCKKPGDSKSGTVTESIIDSYDSSQVDNTFDKYSVIKEHDVVVVE